MPVRGRGSGERAETLNKGLPLPLAAYRADEAPGQ